MRDFRGEKTYNGEIRKRIFEKNPDGFLRTAIIFYGYFAG